MSSEKVQVLKKALEVSNVDVDNIVLGSLTTSEKSKAFGSRIPIFYMVDDEKYYFDIKLEHLDVKYGVSRATLKKGKDGTWTPCDFNGKPKMQGYSKDVECLEKLEKIDEHIRSLIIKENEKIFGKSSKSSKKEKSKKSTFDIKDKSWKGIVKSKEGADKNVNFDIKEFDGNLQTNFFENGKSVKKASKLVKHGGLACHIIDAIVRIKDAWVTSGNVPSYNMRGAYEAVDITGKYENDNFLSTINKYDFFDETDDESEDENEEDDDEDVKETKKNVKKSEDNTSENDKSDDDKSDSDTSDDDSSDSDDSDDE